MSDRRRPRLAVAPLLVMLAVAAALSFGTGVSSAADRPDFQLPFPCGQAWRLDSWGHAPALDMVREPDQQGTEGSLLIAPADGVVESSFRHDNAGEVIQIDHGDGWFTTYLHLESRSVNVGDQVAQGDEIGHVGRSGPTSNDHPHLHFELAVDADGSGSATWGFEGAERVRPWFGGVELGQGNNQTWRDVASGNCGEPPPPPPPPPTTVVETTTTVAPTTTAPATTTTVAPTTTSAPATTTTTAPAVVTTTDPDDSLPRTGSSTTAVGAAIGAGLLAGGAALVLARRYIVR